MRRHATKQALAVLLFVLAATGLACGGQEPQRPSISGGRGSSSPGFSYSAMTLTGRTVALTVRFSAPWVLIVTETEGAAHTEGGSTPLSVGGLAVSQDGGERSPPVVLHSGLEQTLGDPFVDRGALVVAGVRTSSERPDRALLEVVRWVPFESPVVVFDCELPRVVRGQLAIKDGVLSALLEDGAGSLVGLRVALSDEACPSDDALRPLAMGELPEDYRIDWLDGTWAVSGQWGDTLAIQLFGPHLEPLRRLRLTSGGAVRTRDLSFFRQGVRDWMVVYVARIGGAYDVYLAPLSQWRAGPLQDSRIVGTADIERQPVLAERTGRTVVRWVVLDSSSDEWIEIAAVVPPHGSALPGGEVVWRRPTGAGRFGRSVFTEEGLTRVSIEPGPIGPLLVVSPYRPSFW